MDMAAKKHWGQIQNHPDPTVLTFSSKPWHLWLGNRNVSLNAKGNLLKHICSSKARKYWHNKTRFQHTDPDLIDWDGIDILMRDMTIAQK